MNFFQRQSLHAVLILFFLTISISAGPAIAKCWEIEGGGRLFNLNASDNDEGLSVLLDDRLELKSIGLAGRLNWAAALPDVLGDSVIGTNDGVFLLIRRSEESINLLRLSVNTGLTLATTSFPARASDREPQLMRRSGGLFIAFEDEILALNADGSILARRRFETAVDFIQSPGSERVFVRLGDGAIAEVKIRSNAIELEVILRNSLSVDKQVDAMDGFLFTDRAGRVQFFNTSFEKLWEMRAGAGIQSLVPFGDSVFLTSNDNFVYLLNKSGGDIRWRFRTGGRSLGVKLAFESKIYFFIGEIAGGSLFLLDSAGRRLSEISLESEEMVRSIHVSGPDRVVVASNSRVVEYALGGCK